MKGVVKIGLVAATVSFVVTSIGFLIPSLSQTTVSTLDNVQWSNVEINFNQTINSLTEQTFIFYIKQNYSPRGVKVNLSNIINETNFPITNLRDLQFFTRENVTYTVTEITYSYTEGSNITGLNMTDLNSFLKVSYANSTSELISKSRVWQFSAHPADGWYTVNKSNPIANAVTKWRWEWGESKNFLFAKETNKAQGFAGTITMPGTNDKDEYGNPGTKWFKLVITTPITNRGNGWGSSGLFALAVTDADETKEFHPWWDLSWERKQAITVNTSNNIRDYELRLNVTYDSDMQADFDDLRFINASENAELPYTIWQKVDASWAEVFVKVNLTNANGTQLYMYYNNTLASTTRNNFTTFDLYDDFNSLDTTIWNTTTNARVNAGYLILDTASSNKNMMSARNFSLNQTFEMSGSIVTNAQVVEFGFMTTLSSGGGSCIGECAGFVLYSSAGNKLWRESGTNGARTDVEIGASSSFAGNYYNWSVIRNSTGSDINFTMEGQNSGTISTNEPPGLVPVVITATSLQATNLTIDWVRVRTYAYPEPSFSFGAEEAGGLANETGGKNAIEQGIKSSLGSDAAIYTDQQIYVRYVNTSQQLARFDKVTKFGNQIWAFNYVNDSTPFTNMQNITPAFYARELANMGVDNIVTAISNFINQTKT